jgi:hypothetical protein
MRCGDLGRPFIVFSGSTSPGETTKAEKHDNFYGTQEMEIEDDGVAAAAADEDDDDDLLMGRANELLDFFPILADLVEDVQKTCQCSQCRRVGASDARAERSPRLRKDGGCAAFKAFIEVMFYFSHGIADSFGATDASGFREEISLQDLGAVNILNDAIRWHLFDVSVLEGTIT